jgi:hypothetical protein
VTPLIKPLRLFARLFGRWIFRRQFYDRRKATKEALEAYRKLRIKGTGDAVYQLRDGRREKAVDSKRIRPPSSFSGPPPNAYYPAGHSRLRKRSSPAPKSSPSNTQAISFSKSNQKSATPQSAASSPAHRPPAKPLTQRSARS